MSRPTRLLRFLAHRFAAPAGLCLAAAAVLFGLPGCSTSTKTSDKAAKATLETARPIDPALALATFDAAWQLVYDSHFDPNFNGVNWQAVRTELRPRVVGLTDENELREIIEDMLGRLGQSHFALLPREIVETLDDEHSGESDHHTASASKDTKDESATATADADSRSEREGDLGIRVAMIGDDVVVTSVEESSPAGQHGVRSGWVIDAVDGKNLRERIQSFLGNSDDRMVQYQAMAMVLGKLYGPPDSPVTLSMRDEDDHVVEMALTRRERPGQLVKFGNLPPLNANLEHERVVADNGLQIGIIRFTVWMLPLSEPFAAAMHDLRDTDGIVLDLRGNPGGVGGMAPGFASHFLSQVSSLGTMKMRNSELNFHVSPRRVNMDGDRVDPYTGPLTILVDRYTASTSEIFAAGMQAIGRAHVVGEQSAGAALPSQMNELPNGDVLLHAIADFILPTGVSVEGTGVVPDTPVVLTREDLAGGHDPVLEAAIAWIISQPHQHQRHTALLTHE